MRSHGSLDPRVLLSALRRSPAASLCDTRASPGPLAAVARPALRVIAEVDMTTARRSPRRVLSEAERADRRAAEREQMQAAIEALRTSEGWKRWLKVRRHFHTYSFHNQLLIATQCPEATRVAGFRSWLSIGYAVRKGEKAIRIWAPCPPSKRQLAEWKRSASNPGDKPPTYFRLVAVFDRSQVDPLLDFPGGAVELDLPNEPIDGAGLAPLFSPSPTSQGRSARRFRLPRFTEPPRATTSPPPRRSGYSRCRPTFPQMPRSASAIQSLPMPWCATTTTTTILGLPTPRRR